MGNLDGSFWLLVLLVLYFAPAVVAYHRQKRNRFAILVLDTCLGWTLVGWVVALVWAFTVDDRRP